MQKENIKILEIPATHYGNKCWLFNLGDVGNERLVLRSKKDYMKLARAQLSWIDSNEKLGELEYNELITRHQKTNLLASSIRANTFPNANNSFAKFNDYLDESGVFAKDQKQSKGSSLINNTYNYKQPYPQQMPKVQHYNQEAFMDNESFKANFETNKMYNNMDYARSMLHYQQMNQEGLLPNINMDNAAIFSSDTGQNPVFYNFEKVEAKEGFIVNSQVSEGSRGNLFGSGFLNAPQFGKIQDENPSMHNSFPPDLLQLPSPISSNINILPMNNQDLGNIPQHYSFNPIHNTQNKKELVIEKANINESTLLKNNSAENDPKFTKATKKLASSSCIDNKVSHWEETKLNSTFTPTDDSILSGSIDGHLKLWNAIEDFKLINDFGEIHKEWISSMCISVDRRHVYTVANDGRQKKFDVVDKKIIRDYGKIHDAWITCVTRTNDAKYLFTAAKDQSVKQLDLITDTFVKTYANIHKDNVSAITCTPDSKYFYTVSSDKTIKKWDIENKEIIHDFGEVHGYTINCCETTPDNKFLFTGSSDKIIKKWSISDNSCVFEYKNAHKSSVSCIDIFDNSESMLSGSFDKHIKKWNIVDDLLIKDFGITHSAIIRCLCITTDQNRVYSGAADGILKLWSTDDGRLIKNYEEIHLDGLSSIKIVK